MTTKPVISDSYWDQLTPQQKRQSRIANFLNPAGVDFTNSARNAYRIRAQRLIDVYYVEEPDRVPLALHLGSLPLLHYGTGYYTGMYDFSKAIQAFNRFNTEYAEELDNFAFVGMIMPGGVFEKLDYRMYSWPGHGLPQTASGYQFHEGEYMKAGEYDSLIQDPSDFWLRFYIPRIFGALDFLQQLGPLTDLVEIPTGQLMPLATQPMQDLLQKLLHAGQELRARNELMRNHSLQGVAAGFPPQADTFAIAPFDIVGDTLRGTHGIMMDMYQRPDTLLEAIKVLTELQIKSILSRARNGRGLVVTFPLHKGADGWMSQKQFEKFYWPSLKKTIDALVNDGLIVSLFAEGSYNTRLESVNEFPKGSVHWWFDKTDMARAKNVLGDRCCISGNVPSSLLTKGTPAEVKEYCRMLIQTCGSGGGYILSEGAVDIESRVENLQAMAAAVREYGQYRE